MKIVMILIIEVMEEVLVVVYGIVKKLVFIGFVKMIYIE